MVKIKHNTPPHLVLFALSIDLWIQSLPRWDQIKARKITLTFCPDAVITRLCSGSTLSTLSRIQSALRGIALYMSIPD